MGQWDWKGGHLVHINLICAAISPTIAVRHFQSIVNRARIGAAMCFDLLGQTE